jgi:hypothetical protein
VLLEKDGGGGMTIFGRLFDWIQTNPWEFLACWGILMVLFAMFCVGCDNFEEGYDDE